MVRTNAHQYAAGSPGGRLSGHFVDNRAATLRPRAPSQVSALGDLLLKPLNERVLVYQKPFTLLQDVVPEVTPEAEAAFRGKDTLTLTGSFAYQACDDKLCFNPVSVPLSWTMALKPLERSAPLKP